MSSKLPLFAAAGALMASACAFAGPPVILLNEIRADHTGTDTDEYVEIKAPSGTSLAGLTLVVIGDGAAAAGSGVIEHVTALTGTVPKDGHFLLATSTHTLAPAQVNQTVANPGAGVFENNDNVTFLLVTGFTGANGNDLDTDNDGDLDTTPWTAIVDAVGVIEEANPPTGTEFSYGASLGFEDVGPNGMFAPGHIYRCETAGDWLIGAFDTAGGDDTPGVVNPDCPAPCPADINGDSEVDVNDLLLLIGAWGSADPAADINDDGIVDVNDLLLLIGGWGLPCG